MFSGIQKGLNDFHRKVVQPKQELERRQTRESSVNKVQLLKKRFHETLVENTITDLNPHENVLLSNAPERTVRFLGGGLGGSSLVKLKDGGFGVFKPHDGLEIDEMEQQIKSERAAYLISCFLGFDFVPPTVIRELKNPDDNIEQLGSMQQFIEDAKTISELNNAQYNNIPKDELAKLFVFDFMTKNYDRKSANCLLKDNHIFAIDHGTCFSGNSSDLESVLDTKFPYLGEHFLSEHQAFQLQLPKDVYDRLKQLSESFEDQKKLEQLLIEFYGNEKGTLYKDRIVSITMALTSERRIDQDVLKNILDKRISLSRQNASV